MTAKLAELCKSWIQKFLTITTKPTTKLYWIKIDNRLFNRSQLCQQQTKSFFFDRKERLAIWCRNHTKATNQLVWGKMNWLEYCLNCEYVPLSHWLSWRGALETGWDWKQCLHEFDCSVVMVNGQPVRSGYNMDCMMMLWLFFAARESWIKTNKQRL